MTENTWVQVLKEGPKKWNWWRGKKGLFENRRSDWADFRTIDLSGADLSGRNLSKAHLQAVNLKGANLRNANLAKAKLAGADLTDADLRGAFLNFADFGFARLKKDDVPANLSNADLTDCGLARTRFERTLFAGTNLAGARLGEAVFIETDLSEARGLDRCRHNGPTVLDHHTLLLSQRLPLSFYRGCGVPERLIELLMSAPIAPLQYVTCFISYSTADQQFAERLHANLQSSGVRCWFAPHDITGGKKIHEQIDEAIRVYDRLLLILSDSSMNSRWVKTEIANALDKEQRSGRRVLFPVSLVPFDRLREWTNFNADIGIDAAREIREYYVPDFTNWQSHDSYEAAFDKLLKGLEE